MNVLIACFSQTGGTEKIAKMIQEGIINSNNECKLVNLIHTNPKNLNEYDIIGIGAPTFYFREPVNVRNFIKKLDVVDGKHSFLFCTHGSIIGNTFYHMNEELSKKGYITIGAFDSYALSSMQYYPKIVHTVNHPDDIELDEAREFGEKMCNLSLKVKNGESNVIPEFILNEEAWWAISSKNLSLEYLRKIHPKFEINIEKCTKCLECQENCPAEAINIEADPPEIQNEGCIFCLYCEKLCPEGAIEADWELMRAGGKGNLKKYVQALKEAELKGKFRPYVDYEKII